MFRKQFFKNLTKAKQDPRDHLVYNNSQVNVGKKMTYLFND